MGDGMSTAASAEGWDKVQRITPDQISQLFGDWTLPSGSWVGQSHCSDTGTHLRIIHALVGNKAEARRLIRKGWPDLALVTQEDEAARRSPDWPPAQTALPMFAFVLWPTGKGAAGFASRVFLEGKERRMRKGVMTGLMEIGAADWATPHAGTTTKH